MNAHGDDEPAVYLEVVGGNRVFAAWSHATCYTGNLDPL